MQRHTVHACAEDLLSKLQLAPTPMHAWHTVNSVPKIQYIHLDARSPNKFKPSSCSLVAG
jgi:hypothetical protein